MSPTIIAAVLVAVALIGLFTWKSPRLAGALVWAFVAALLVTAAFDIVAPGPFADRVILSSVCIPIVWVGFQFWLYWDPIKWRVVSVLIALSGLSGVVIALAPPAI
ncbi:MAG: hypothetical protein AAF668_04850 [Pseudomonadota bacterium]